MIKLFFSGPYFFFHPLNLQLFVFHFRQVAEWLVDFIAIF